MPHSERVDPVERTLLTPLANQPGLQAQAARILDEGADLQDILTPPGRRPLVTVAAILVRAFRPPFKFPDNTPLGAGQLWEIGHR